ncbi:MAG: ATP-binding protein [Bacteroidia bacterium]|nr:ATP-binding protein [Bacteroidia bacterium]
MIFRIHEIEVIDNPHFGCCVFNLTNKNLEGWQIERKDPSREGPYFSVLIGPNGAGKSNALQLIINIFRELSFLQKNGTRGYFVVGGFSIVYEIGSVTYRFGNILYDDGVKRVVEISNKAKVRGAWWLHDWSDRKGEPRAYTDLHLPFNLLVSAQLISDKFPYLSDTSFPGYTYLGIRNGKTTAGTRSLVKRTVDIIIKALEEPFLKYMITRSAEFLGADQITVKYKILQRGRFFSGTTTENSFGQWYGDPPKEISTREKWYYNNFDKYSANKGFFNRLATYCNEIILNETHFQPYRDEEHPNALRYSFTENSDIQKHAVYIKALYELGIISYPVIGLENTAGSYDLTESSSGEYNFLTSILSIASSLRSQSLVLIDEPEISLHPNWQMRYFSFLRRVFSDFPDCHFIICTHSHFLISDLPGDQSKILSMSRKTKESHSEKEIKKSPILVKRINAKTTFGWSAEQVLLDVFDVPTTRNFYIAERLSEILKKASASKNVDLSEYREELIKWYNTLQPNDPLHYTIEQILKRSKWLD